MSKETALDQVGSPATLDAAWKRILSSSRPRSRHTAGLDGESIDDVRKHSGHVVGVLAQQLKAKTFSFSPLKPQFIPKPGGKERLICIPAVRDRIVQRALLSSLTPRYQKLIANEISYGFVEGRSVADAATRACFLRAQRGWVYKTDIGSFFDNIARDQLAVTIRRRIREKSVWPLLVAASACEVKPWSANENAKIEAAGIFEGKGVRQGMPLSPFFANLFLDRFDEMIIKKKLAAVRYADDLIFFADSEKECGEIDELCRLELKKIGLTIPPLANGGKTVIYEPGDVCEFLGLGLQKNGAYYELVLLQSQREKIREKLDSLGDIQYLNSKGISLSNLGMHITSRISGYMSAYEHCTNVNELENVLIDQHQKILRRVLGPNGLKVPLSSLSPAARTFVGLQ